MALNIKNSEVETLAAEVARMAGESKTEAIRRALAERRDRLMQRSGRHDRYETLVRLLERDLWPLVPAEVLGKEMSRAEREAILGYGPEGV